MFMESLSRWAPICRTDGRISQQPLQVAAELVERGRRPSRRRQIELGGQGRLVHRLAIPARHPSPQPFLGAANRFRLRRRLQIGRQSVNPAERNRTREKPGLEFAFRDDDRQGEAPALPPGPARQSRRKLRGTIAVGIQENQHRASGTGLACGEFHGALKLLPLDQFSAWNAVRTKDRDWGVEKRDHPPKQHGNRLVFPVTLDDRGQVHDETSSNRSS